MATKRSKKSKHTVPKESSFHQWDIAKQKPHNGYLVDGRSGQAKFYGQGRSKDRSLSSMDSWEDNKLERQLWAQVKAGKRFAEPKKKDPK